MVADKKNKNVIPIPTTSYLSLSTTSQSSESVDFTRASKPALSASTKHEAVMAPSRRSPDLAALTPAIEHHCKVIAYRVSRDPTSRRVNRAPIAAEVSRWLLPDDLVSRDANGTKKKPACSWSTSCFATLTVSCTIAYQWNASITAERTLTLTDP